MTKPHPGQLGWRSGFSSQPTLGCLPKLSDSESSLLSRFTRPGKLSLQPAIRRKLWRDLFRVRRHPRKALRVFVLPTLRRHPGDRERRLPSARSVSTAIPRRRASHHFSCRMSGATRRRTSPRRSKRSTGRTHFPITTTSTASAASSTRRGRRCLPSSLTIRFRTARA